MCRRTEPPRDPDAEATECDELDVQPETSTEPESAVELLIEPFAGESTAGGLSGDAHSSCRGHLFAQPFGLGVTPVSAESGPPATSSAHTSTALYGSASDAARSCRSSPKLKSVGGAGALVTSR